MAWKCGKHPGKAIPNGEPCPEKGCNTMGHGWTKPEMDLQIAAVNADPKRKWDPLKGDVPK